MSRKKLLKLEQLKSFMPVTIGDRINCVVANSGLTGAKFCKIVGISTGNLNGLINDDSNPSAKFSTRILELYNININWLLTGEGEMIRRDEKSSLYNKVEPDDSLEFKISDALAMTARVLESDTSYATALFLNIQHFDRAIQAEARIIQLEENQGIMESRVDTLETKFKNVLKNDRRQEQRRQEDKGPMVEMEERRSGEERRVM